MSIEAKVSYDEISPILSRYEDGARTEFYKLVETWPEELSEKPVPRVLGALVARQTTLALSLVSYHSLWNHHLAPLILRSLLENWLKIEWLIRDPVRHACGIAKADLTGAKTKVQRIAAKKNPGTKERAEEIVDLLTTEEQMFQSEQKTIIVDPRTMANKAGGEALIAYRRHHVLFSSCVHSSWNHIARFNLTIDPNPLHRYPFIPMWKEIVADLNFPLLAAEYCDKAFHSVTREETGNPYSAYKQLVAELSKLGVIQTLPSDTDDEYSSG